MAFTYIAYPFIYLSLHGFIYLFVYLFISLSYLSSPFLYFTYLQFLPPSLTIYLILIIMYLIMYYLFCLEWYFTQASNHKRLKFYYIFTLLKILVLLSLLPCYKNCQNAICVNFDLFIQIYGYVLRYLTKRGYKCLAKEVNLHIFVN